MPLTEICAAEYSDPRQRQLYKNIVYVGALAALLDIELEVIEKLIGEQFKGKDKLIDANRGRSGSAIDEAKARFDCPLRHSRPPQRGGRRPHSRRRQFRRRPRRGLWRGDGLRLVPDHALDLARRGVRAQLRPLPHRPGDGQEELRHRPGRGRDRRHRHGDRRRLERRARLHRDLGARHFADAGILRPRLFRRNPGRRVRRAARRPVDRHADPHPAVGPPLLRLRLARRHQACAADSRRPERGVRIRRERLRSRRAAADAGVRHARSRHRHEFASLRAVRNGTTRAPTTAARFSRSTNWKTRRTSAATTTSTATAFPIAPFPAPIRRAAPISPAAPAATASPATPRKACPISTTWSGSSASSRPRARLLPRPVLKPAAKPTRIGVLYYGSTAAADGRGAGTCWRTRACMSTRCASAPFRSRGRSPISSTRHDRDLRRRAEPRRADAHADDRPISASRRTR